MSQSGKQDPGKQDHDSLRTGMRSSVYFYGPPGSGKSTLACEVAQALNLPFYDTDELIVAKTGTSIPDIFEKRGEGEFRNLETDTIFEVITQGPAVVALGGGALLRDRNRSTIESIGQVICLRASPHIIFKRLYNDQNKRPLLAGNERDNLINLLNERDAHYRSFPLQLDTEQGKLTDLVWTALIQLGAFHITGMGEGYDVRVYSHSMDYLGEELRIRQLQGPVALVSDENVGELYAERTLESLRNAGFTADAIIIKAGEKYKTLSTIKTLWEEFVKCGLDRGSTIVALGGGVVGDLAGFAAATFLRGVRWVCLPTSILAMVDASLGGKTGVDLLQGKNLIGAFHPPALVLVDASVLSTLPHHEKRNGLAEVVKHSVIADPDLYELCDRGWEEIFSQQEQVIRRGMAVKVGVILDDPYEQGCRATLNFGHTLGHAIEKSSSYQVSHGEAVAIGMVAATRLSERLGIAEQGLSDKIVKTLQNLGLPCEIPPKLSRKELMDAMNVDKKRAAGVVQLVLPVKIGEVRYGITVENLEELIN